MIGSADADSRKLAPGETVGVLGAGTMGRAVARFAARLGHPVVLGSRRAGVADEDPAGETVRRGSWSDALREGERLTFLTTLWSDRAAVVRAVQALEAPYRGVLVDCTNPETGDGPGLAVGTGTSGAEILARRLPGIPVVKALNHVYAEVLDAGPEVGSGRAAAFLCGDDSAARRAIRDFLARGGFDAVDVGPLSAARYLEPAAQLMVALVRGCGMPAGDVALGLLRRA